MYVFSDKGVDSMAYEKLLNEIYAVVSLKYLWPEYKPFFVKSESPDWINDTMDFGLEISQALLPEDGQTENFIENYLGCLKEDLPESAIERYGDRLHFYNGRFWAVLPNPEIEQDYVEKALYRFHKKLEKLNTNYKKYNRNGLYLYLHPEAGDEEMVDVEALFRRMKEEQKDMQVQFDWVFLNCVKSIYVCDFVQERLEKIVLPKNAENFLNTETEYLRYTFDWDDGVILEDEKV